MRIWTRQATKADFDFLYALHVAAMRPSIEATWGWHEPWQRAYFARKWDPAPRRIIRVDGVDAGVLVLRWEPDALYLSLIELLPAFQGRGVGTAVLQSLIARAAARGLPVTLHVLKA